VQRLRIMQLMFSQLEEHRRMSQERAPALRDASECDGEDPAHSGEHGEGDGEGEDEARRSREWRRGSGSGDLNWEGEDEGMAEPDAAAANPSSSSSSSSSSILRRGGVVQRFKGHLNVATVKDVSWYGPHGEFVMSGSDCGRFFVWRVRDGGLVQCLPADSHTVNVIEAHPWEPIVASCGIDNDVKLWEPLRSPSRVARSWAGVSTFDTIAATNAQRLAGVRAHEGVPAGCAIQ